ncbi:hypothetical protein [Halobacterium rubrum]|uniref:hypothetical protein n=1 Tax=Halobacterium TaxID=2239 RepID=UPI001F3091BC|nr:MULTISPECIES: hypothetical protein [Halobacterium]MDH5018930.1 hypothetical protein [Halobacterium rubrum]
MGKTGHAVLVVALFVAAVAAVPGGAAAADGGLHVSGEQADDGTVTVTVTDNETAVANASVTVDALNNSTYAGEGGYETGENGTVTLPAPEQNVSVDVTAAANNTTASTTLDLVAPTDDGDEESLAVDVTQADDGSATVDVTTNGTGVANASVGVTAQDNVSYAGEGDYETGENGTVDLPAPEQNVTVDVTAEADNLTASATATLTAVEDNGSEANESFGARVSAFVHSLQAGGNMSGHAVAAFVTDNNPGADNRSDNANAGPPEEKGNDKAGGDDEKGADSEDDEKGAEDENDEKKGNNGNGNGNADDDEDDEDDDEEKGNNGNGNGNGNGGGNGNGPP